MVLKINWKKIVCVHETFLIFSCLNVFVGFKVEMQGHMDLHILPIVFLCGNK
jgi:hypothetical protein